MSDKHCIFMIDDDDEEGEGMFIDGVFDSLEEAKEYLKVLPDEVRKEGSPWEWSPWYKHDTHFFIYRIEMIGEPIKARDLL